MREKSAGAAAGLSRCRGNQDNTKGRRGNEDEPCIRRVWRLIVRRQIPVPPFNCLSKSSALRRVTRVNTLLNRGSRRLDRGSHRVPRVFYVEAPLIDHQEGRCCRARFAEWWEPPAPDSAFTNLRRLRRRFRSSGLGKIRCSSKRSRRSVPLPLFGDCRFFGAAVFRDCRSCDLTFLV